MLDTPQHAQKTTQAVGMMLREWRSQRRFSQMDLALDVGVSPRHLSFIETGRSRPSPEMLVALADRLEIPLRERNHLLLAAGYAPRYRERPFDDAAMHKVHDALDRLLRAHEPYPGLVLDRYWNVVLANGPAHSLTMLLPPLLKEPRINIFRASLHPDGLAKWTENFEDWARYLLRVLRRAVAATGDALLAGIEHDVRGYPNVGQVLAVCTSERDVEDSLLVPCTLCLPSGRLSMFTTVTSFGTPHDVTLDELCVELFYPADDASERLLRQAADEATAQVPRRQ
jgi:transcriptional regulator with XRE-family HTH domain